MMGSDLLRRTKLKRDLADGSRLIANQREDAPSRVVRQRPQSPVDRFGSIQPVNSSICLYKCQFVNAGGLGPRLRRRRGGAQQTDHPSLTRIGAFSDGVFAF